ncbi:MAG: DUF4167 domain-containing protein [Alphaproteobacteria bacterium]
MRPSQKSNRARGRGNRRANGTNVNRVFESTGPDGKVRGTPQQIMDKYLSLARDAQTQDNRVAAESFFQHAEHYHRLLAEAMGARQERRDSQQPDQHDRPADLEAEVDGEAATPASTDGQRRDGPSRGADRTPREPEVSGLTMIDSGQTDTGSLLVDAEELSASQPRRRRRGQDRGQPETPTSTEADAQPE